MFSGKLSKRAMSRQALTLQNRQKTAGADIKTATDF